MWQNNLSWWNQFLIFEVYFLPASVGGFFPSNFGSMSKKIWDLDWNQIFPKLFSVQTKKEHVILLNLRGFVSE